MTDFADVEPRVTVRLFAVRVEALDGVFVASAGGPEAASWSGTGSSEDDALSGLVVAVARSLCGRERR